MSAAAARIRGTLVTRPVTTNEIPMITCATITDARRLYESATTPVGTSNAKYAISMNVPVRTSWSGSIPTSCTKYTGASVHPIAIANDSAPR